MKFAAHLGIAAAAAIVCFGFVSAPHIAHAQKSNCILDNCADQKPAAAVPAKPDTMTTMAHRHVSNAPGDFDFYVLALSWSPGFCQTHNARRAGAQCESGSNLGFVVHGLWPQDTHGFPSRCEPAARYPSRFALEGAKGLYPDIGLARHEWSMHGTCSGKSPTDYFAEVRRARAAVVIPPQFRNTHATQTWTPVDIQRAFIAANPRLRPGMLAVACNRSVLSEVRICLSKDLRNFVACPEVARHFCYAHQITVPPVR